MKTLIITILSIILLLGVSLTTLHAGDITDVSCPCGCIINGKAMRAIDCGCASALEALKKAGYSTEDIEKHLKSKGVI